MSLLLPKINRDKFFLLINLSSGLVNAALFLQSKEKDSIIATSEKNFYSNDKKTGKEYEDNLIKSIDFVLKDVMKKKSKYSITSSQPDIIENVYINLSTPWYQSKIKNISVKKDKNFTLSKKILNNLLKKTQNPEYNIENYSIIEDKIISVTVNGYVVDNPFNKRINSFSLTNYVSYISKDLFNKIEDKIKNIINVPNINFITHPVINLSVIKNIFGRSSNIIVIDVSEENSEVMFIRNTILEDLVSIPIGTNFYIRELQKKYKIDHKSTLAKIEMYLEDRIEKNQKKYFEKHIDIINSEFIKIFDKAISDLVKRAKTPCFQFLFIDETFKDIFKDLLYKREMKLIFKHTKNPVTYISSSENFPKNCIYEQKTKENHIISLMANYVNIINN